MQQVYYHEKNQNKPANCDYTYYNFTTSEGILYINNPSSEPIDTENKCESKFDDTLNQQSSMFAMECRVKPHTPLHLKHLCVNKEESECNTDFCDFCNVYTCPFEYTLSCNFLNQEGNKDINNEDLRHITKIEEGCNFEGSIATRTANQIVLSPIDSVLKTSRFTVITGVPPKDLNIEYFNVDYFLM